MISVKQIEPEYIPVNSAAKDAETLLSHIQRQLKVPKLREKKGAGANYKYRNTEDILESVKKLLPDSAYVTIEDTIEVHGHGELQRFYVKATAQLRYGNTSISSTAIARETLEKLNRDGFQTMDSAQLTGSASSYARKYALNGLFCIDDTRDADEIGVCENETNNSAGEKKYKLLSLIQQLNVPAEVVNKWLSKEGVNDIAQFSQEQSIKYIKFLETKRGV